MIKKTTYFRNNHEGRVIIKQNLSIVPAMKAENFENRRIEGITEWTMPISTHLNDFADCLMVEKRKRRVQINKNIRFVSTCLRKHNKKLRRKKVEKN